MIQPNADRINDPHQSWSSRNRYTNEDEYLHENNQIEDLCEETLDIYERGD